MKTLVFVACHPDDEVLSGGRLLCSAQSQNYNLSILWLTKGEASGSAFAASRVKEAERVASRLGATALFLGFPDGKMLLHQVIGPVEKELRRLNPSLVVWPHGYVAEHHQDHRVLHEAMTNICKRWSYASCCWMVLQPPVYDDPNFRPNLFLPFDQYQCEQIENLMGIYESERKKPFAKSDFIAARAKRWAHEGSTGSTYAEPVSLLKGLPPRDLFRVFPVEFLREKGGIPVLDKLDSLDKPLQARALALFDRIMLVGPELVEGYSRKLSENIYSLSSEILGQRISVVYFIDPNETAVILELVVASSNQSLAEDTASASLRRHLWLEFIEKRA